MYQQKNTAEKLL